MSNISTFVNNTSYSEGLGNGICIASNKLDFATTNVAASDVVACIKIPADSIVLAVRTFVLTAEGTSTTGTFGRVDASDFGNASADGWIGTFNFNTAGYDSSLVADTYPALNGKAETVNTYITCTPASALDACIMFIYVDFIKSDFALS
jgi:hypothetical protein